MNLAIHKRNRKPRPLGRSCFDGIILQITLSTLIGSLLPLGARALNMDPAVVSAPGITSTVGISGMLIYFFTAKLMLGL